MAFRDTNFVMSVDEKTVEQMRFLRCFSGNCYTNAFYRKVVELKDL